MSEERRKEGMREVAREERTQLATVMNNREKEIKTDRGGGGRGQEDTRQPMENEAVLGR